MFLAPSAKRELLRDYSGKRVVAYMGHHGETDLKDIPFREYVASLNSSMQGDEVSTTMHYDFDEFLRVLGNLTGTTLVYSSMSDFYFTR